MTAAPPVEGLRADRPLPWFALLESNTTGTGREFCAAARQRGLRPVLLTRDPGRYAYVATDSIETRLLDTGDPDAIAQECAALADAGGLAGVGSSSEYFIAAAARVAGDMGLPAPDPVAVERCRNKYSQRQVLAAAGVAVPSFASASDVSQACEAAQAIGYPVVLKPVSGSGSVGVRLCRDTAQVARWASELLGRSVDERGNPVPTLILVEATVHGPEFSVETFDGEVVAVVGKHLGAEPYFVEIGHDVPAVVPKTASAALAETAAQAVAALGLGWGAVHTELRLAAEGPVVIEVNPRLAGGMIPVAVRAALGVDLVDAVVARAAGQPVAQQATAERSAAIRFRLARHEGHVEQIGGLAAAEDATGVVAATVSTAVGREVRITHSFLDRQACVVATGADADEAVRNASAALDLIRIRLAGSGSSETGVAAAVATASMNPRSSA